MANNRPAYAFVDAAQIRDLFDKQGEDWRNVSLHAVALQATDRAWQGDGLVFARAFAYDAVRDGDGGDEPHEREQYRRDVKDWLDRNELQKDTHVRRGNLAGDPTSKSMRQKGVDG